MYLLNYKQVIKNRRCLKAYKGLSQNLYIIKYNNIYYLTSFNEFQNLTTCAKFSHPLRWEMNSTCR